MASTNLTLIFPPRCGNVITSANDPTGQNALPCGKLADLLSDIGPLCNSCASELTPELTSPISPLWIRANVEASRELDKRFAQIGNGLFCRVGRGKGGR